MLDRNKRITLECLQCKRIAGRTQSFCVKNRIIPLKELLNNIENCGFTCSGSSIQNHKFLQFFRFSTYHRTNSPFNFPSLSLRVQSRHQFVISRQIASFKRIFQLFTGVIFFIGFCIGEYQFVIQHVERIPHLLLTIFMPGINHPGFRIPHVKNFNFRVKALAAFFCVSIQFTVNELQSILFVRRP